MTQVDVYTGHIVRHGEFTHKNGGVIGFTMRCDCGWETLVPHITITSAIKDGAMEVASEHARSSWAVLR